MNSIAVFPGSFDPITIGHVDLINRAIPLFDKIIIAIGVNSQKQTMFTIDQRMSWLNELFSGNEKLMISSYEGLTVDFCRSVNANFILRGWRNAFDFEYERTIASLNRSMFREIETIMLATAPAYSHISSTIVRELIKYKGNFDHLVPACISRDVKKI